MAALLFSLVIVLLVGVGARDQVLLATMVTRQGRRPGLLLVALVSGIASVAVAAWASRLIASSLGVEARMLFAAIALAWAGLEMLFARRTTVPAEPTHSLGAFALVLFAHQLTDAARFAVLALAVATQAPLLAAMGGGTAAVALALAGWLGAEEITALDLAGLRRAIGSVLILVALVIAVRALGLS
ncbi:MAG: hypothetical protein KGM49_06585 [Sphingomonadales bacterium]|nr:hypothetical protein [Sphingomonadales bacterium]